MSGGKVRRDFLGRGWGFPFRFDDASGSVRMSSHERNIQESITVILGTRPGERQRLPDFGCRIHELMFAPNNAATGTLAARHVRSALERWEPRIEVTRIDAEPEASGVMKVSVAYRVRSTQQLQELDLLITG
ncbi:MAG: GPW/gp25 family protein [Myxococcota bacterium]